MASVCNDCKIGKILLSYDQSVKHDKTMGRIEFMRKAKGFGAICFGCIHNGIKGRKAKALARLSPGFQSLDMLNLCVCPNCEKSLICKVSKADGFCDEFSLIKELRT